jgi:hypothetical protein
MFKYSARVFVVILCVSLFACEQSGESNKSEGAKKVASDVQSEKDSSQDHSSQKDSSSNTKPKSSKQSSVTSGYIPFPEGYGYMQDLQLLQEATDVGDRDYIRQHAWSLWAGIMQPSEELGWPLWYSWPNTHAAFQNTNPSPVGAAVSDKSAQELKQKAVSKVKTKAKRSHSTIVQKNLANAPDVDTPAPIYDLPQAVIQKYPGGICQDSQGNSIACDGSHFLNNGDILIPTESLSMTAMNQIRDDKLYLQSTLNEQHASGQHMIEMNQKWIVTKHMYWPVKAQGLTGIPVWKNNFPTTFTGYAGYEYWDTLVAVDPSGQQVGKTANVSFLHGVKDHEGNSIETVTADAEVYGLDSFYFHKITQEDWDSFDEGDKAVLSSASYWANGQDIGVGDYLVSIAMHVNTKELASWTLQSVWWSDTPNEGIYAENRPQLPQAQGPWDHYLLTDSYAVPANPDGKVDIAVNPYIEGVIHPIATSCRNCHVRAGWPTGKKAGTASYQNPDCPGLLDDLTPKSECLKDLTLTDYLWIIPDRAVKQQGPVGEE